MLGGLTKQDFIEKSILSNSPMTELFLCIGRDKNVWEITDGLQRYTALTEYIR